MAIRADAWKPELTGLEARLADGLSANFAAVVDSDPLDRSGWLRCSDFNHKPPTCQFSPRFCVQQYLGLAPRKSWTPEQAWTLIRGRAVDEAAAVAMNACGEFLQTQVKLYDPPNRLAGTPDFAVEFEGEWVIGDVKATDNRMFYQHLANEAWPLKEYYAWRQLQAYLLLSQTEWGLMIAFNAEYHGPPFGHHEYGSTPYRAGIRDRIHVRRFYRDERCIKGILADVLHCNECIDRYLAATTDQERSAALPRY